MELLTAIVVHFFLLLPLIRLCKCTVPRTPCLVIRRYARHLVPAQDWNYWSLLEISEMEGKRRQPAGKDWRKLRVAGVKRRNCGPWCCPWDCCVRPRESRSCNAATLRKCFGKIG